LWSRTGTRGRAGIGGLRAGEDVEGRRECGGRHRQAGSFKDGFEFAGADDGVHFRDALADFVAIALDEAAGDDEFARPTGGFVAGHFKDGVDRFLLGGVDEAAGIHDEDFCFFRTGSEARAGAVQQTHHDSESTRFLGQPKEIKPTVGAVGGESLLTLPLYREWY